MQGSIRAAGFKNAATPILAACILIKDTVTLHNVPLIEDVKKMIQILVSMGAKVNWIDKNSLKVDCSDLNQSKLNMDLVSAMRSSVLLIGALVGRFGKVRMKEPGGCQIGSRPIDSHLKALAQLGIKSTIDDQYYYFEKVSPASEEIIMSEFSVTGTENVILAAALNHGSVDVRLAACEPSIQDLCWFLESAGVKFLGIGTHNLKINGSQTLHGTEYHIMPDPIETGTFICLAGATRSKLTIERTAPEFLLLEIEKFKETGLHLDIEYTGFAPGKKYRLADIKVNGKVELLSVKKLHDMPHPGFAPDLIQPFTVMMTQARGTTLVHDWMYDGRLKYVAELKKMGANIVVSDPHRIIVIGPAPLFGKDINSFDLRAGATLIIAALSASGKSIVNNVYQVDRGYEMLDQRLSALGAKIERIDD